MLAENRLAHFAHAPDYSWLLGILEESTAGHLELRYAPTFAEDRCGGRVTMPEDTRLGVFQPGDLLFVEGEIQNFAGPSPAVYFIRSAIRLHTES
jgi:hypothetical protein